MTKESISNKISELFDLYKSGAYAARVSPG
jgi:hypothetical protein